MIKQILQGLVAMLDAYSLDNIQQAIGLVHQC